MTIWQSNEHWNDGYTNTIKGEGFDGTSGLYVRQLSDEDRFSGYFKILGNGSTEFKSSSGRLFVFKDTEEGFHNNMDNLWGPNIEVSAEIKVTSIAYPERGKNFIDLGGPTNHWVNLIDRRMSEYAVDGRNYSLDIRLDRSHFGFKKETVHSIYDDIETKDWQMPLNRWYKFRYRQTIVEDDRKLKLEAWINGTKQKTYTDTGEFTDHRDPDNREVLDKYLNKSLALYGDLRSLGQVWTLGAYSGCYIRFNRISKGYIRNLVVKEL
jgi:hypothetical protein